MINQLETIEETPRIGPGPSYVPPSVYETLSKLTSGQLDQKIAGIMA